MDFIGVIIMVSQLILALSILIGVHEFGHLIAAKAFGMRVEQFSIGFPPRIFSFKYGETVYAIGSIPLGGFVKISGMIDESLDTKQMSSEPQPWEFRSKPAWQRLIVMMGGIIVNVIIGIIIFIFITFIYGESYVSKEELNNKGIVAYELGEEIGLQTGDKIVNVNGEEFDRMSDIFSYQVLLEDNSYFTVDRNGEQIRVDVPADLIEKLSNQNSDKGFIDIRRPFYVAEVLPNTGASNAGLENGDKIVAINGEPIEYFHEVKPILEQHKMEKVSITVLKNAINNENPPKRTLEVQVSDDATLGFRPEFQINLEQINYSFAQAIPIGTTKAFEMVWVNIKAFGRILTGKLNPAKSLRGPIGIMQEFGYTWDWFRFWSLTGLLSMVLAFMNFLPIPALDGGHVAFLTYEMVSGRKPSDKFLENAQKVGMVLLLTLMVFVIFNDFINFF